MKDLSRTSLCATLLGAGLFLFSALARGETTAAPDFYGSLRASYDYRSLGDYEDHDVYGFWHLRGRNLADKRVEIYTSGRVHSDLDGTSSDAYDPFGGIDDGSKGDLRLLQFYVDIHDRKNEKGVRYGRQYVDVADYIQMDGAQVRLFEQQAIGGRVFLGRPVSDYSSVSGDLFLGASLVGRPWEGNRSRVTYARYQDDSESANDDHVFLDAKQQLGDEVRGRAYLSVMNEDVRMGGADLYYVSLSDHVLDAVLGVKRWGDYQAGSRVYSPLVDIMGDVEPYTTAYGRITTEVLPWFYLSPGAMMKQPDDSDFANRRFERYDLNFIFEPAEGLSASIALEYWDVEENDRFFGVSGDIRYRYRRLWEVSVGAAYVDYTYFQLPEFTLTPAGGDTRIGDDGTRIETSPDAYTYYLRGRWNITENTALRLSGEIEDDSFEDDLGYRVRTSFEVRL